MPNGRHHCPSVEPQVRCGGGRDRARATGVHVGGGPSGATMPGHESLETTQISTRVSALKLPDIHAAAPPSFAIERGIEHGAVDSEGGRLHSACYPRAFLCVAHPAKNRHKGRSAVRMQPAAAQCTRKCPARLAWEKPRQCRWSASSGSIVRIGGGYVDERVTASGLPPPAPLPPPQVVGLHVRTFGLS